MYRLHGAGEDGPPAIPPWLQQPQDELPVPLAVGEFLERTDGTVISVSHLDVFSTGIVIHAVAVVRRRDEPDRDWSWLIHGAFGRRERTGDELRWSVELANGSTAEFDDIYRRHPTFDERPDGWTLARANGSGGGGGADDRWEQHHGLWLWPLPPAGPLELGVEWGERGVPESRITLDGDAILAAVPRVRSLWP